MISKIAMRIEGLRFLCVRGERAERVEEDLTKVHSHTRLSVAGACLAGLQASPQNPKVQQRLAEVKEGSPKNEQAPQ